MLARDDASGLLAKGKSLAFVIREEWGRIAASREKRFMNTFERGSSGGKSLKKRPRRAI